MTRICADWAAIFFPLDVFGDFSGSFQDYLSNQHFARDFLGSVGIFQDFLGFSKDFQDLLSQKLIFEGFSGSFLGSLRIFWDY